MCFSSWKRRVRVRLDQVGQPERILYQRLGGADGIASIVDGIVDAHMDNPTIRPRFRPYGANPDRLATLKEHLRNFLGAGTGGPEPYDRRA